ncbi:MAG TPA: VOC family protein [Porticoccaceae bacterium]
MTTFPFGNRTIIQNSWIVTDIHAAMAAWTKNTGIGPFFLVEDVTIEDQLYRGQPTHLDVTYALAQAGDIQIELVCQHNDVPSAYRDTIPAGSSGFHHVALYCTDYDADLAAYQSAGAEVAFSGCFGGKRFCYLDTSAALGFMVELIEASDAQDSFFRRLREAAHNWDGRDPVRPAF